MTPKQRWKIVHRAMRVMLRDTQKAREAALLDCWLFGTGVIRITADGKAEHVPRSEWRA